MRVRSLRVWLFLGVLAFLACYTVHMDESQIRSQTAADLDCDPALVQLELSGSSSKTTAHVAATGCGVSRNYTCKTDANGTVTCSSAISQASAPSENESDGTAGAVVGAAAAGCACASLFGSKSSDPNTTTSSPTNPNSTTPQRTH